MLLNDKQLDTGSRNELKNDSIIKLGRYQLKLILLQPITDAPAKHSASAEDELATYLKHP